jgi:hypothetical protein
VPDTGDKRHLTAENGVRSTVTGSAAARTGVAAAAGRTAAMSHLDAPQPAAAAPAGRRKGAADPLRVGGRIMLGTGERFVASGSTKDDGGMMVLAGVGFRDRRDEQAETLFVLDEPQLAPDPPAPPETPRRRTSPSRRPAPVHPCSKRCTDLSTSYER